MSEVTFRNFYQNECLFTDVGLVDVYAADRLMSVAQVWRSGNEIPDILLFLRHPKTVALGLRHRLDEWPKDLLVSPAQLEEEGIALTRSVRGGGITYHWPGQVVCYPVLALRGTERDVPAYMEALEEVCIRTLQKFGVSASRRRDSAAHVGLWLDHRKVVSMGVRISRWVTSFGFAVNVGGDYAPSRYVRPCGIEGARLTTMEEILGQAPSRQAVREAVMESFAEVFAREMNAMPARLRIRLAGAEGTGPRERLGGSLSETTT